ncbi:hypothetical protein BJ322DRAFT_685231 [Thelephora terrestris]|uniref:MD-2-related lipid-recognition domain-containing protein n=1 Tax=Thelephora terrestris TaxID=56493 RepID=A0A9P6HGT4_9AGAM|nr:hypothetical protein BJ322DRAFT_685231 [Thelephora terrestris]
MPETTEKWEVLPISFGHHNGSLVPRPLVLAFSAAPSAAPALGGVRVRGNQDFESFGGTNRLVSVEISPSPPVPGQRLSVTVNAFTPAEILDSLAARVSVGHATEPLWGELFNISDITSYPIQPGFYSFTYNIRMPEDISRNEIGVLTRGFSPTKEGLFCFLVTL